MPSTGWTSSFCSRAPGPARSPHADLPGIEDVNSTALWDTHLLRDLDDEDFKERLYQEGHN